MQAAVHETGPPGDGATISDGGVAVFDHSNILAILSSSSLAIFSASSVVPGRDADVVVVVVTTTNIKIASFSKGMIDIWMNGLQGDIPGDGIGLLGHERKFARGGDVDDAIAVILLVTLLQPGVADAFVATSFFSERSPKSPTSLYIYTTETTQRLTMFFN
ncbi:hypothetical protein Tco_0439717, partial [Tanacetum coccineum]